ncbi:putative ABC transporter permease [Thermophilibacter sp. ET337]|uniref:putative ABC transporter permease n=1 Tax=Thermophilibacter sp. ET337 TaxID=2973084 RepID=UPI0021ACBF6B|nr:putative ABC transporter permease [Thermophilibacter sp. ET337]MCR8907288.1 putative ABC transporter permease [Thermophilibacter sp. ET337]
MFLSLIFVVFLFAVIQGFVRVVVYFWEWLSRGDQLDEDDVERAEAALEESEDALERELARAGRARGLSRLFARWRASAAAVDEYLDHLHLGWYQIVIIFFLGSMAGLLIEEVWMLATAGLTENRVGLVWGPFSPLYGLGAVLLTLLSFFLRGRGARAWQVFVVSAVVGGVLEQLTGWSMSTFFDAESWTYLHLPDHITQWVAWRFLAFWGLLGLTWSRAVMPRLLYQIGMPTTRRQAVFVTLVAIYLVADVVMTLVCFDRKAERDAGVPPANAFEQWVDTNYSDEFIAGRFENLKIGDARDKVDENGDIILDEVGDGPKKDEV